MNRRNGPVRRVDAPESRLYESRVALADVDTTANLSYLEGRAVPYDTVTDTGWYYFEQFARGALGESIDAAGPLPLLLWHDNRTWPIGVADEWVDAADGLHGVWRLDDSTEAQRAARQARDGFLTGMSISFAPVEDRREARADWEDWDPSDPDTWDVVTRVQARLLETSLTPTPAYADAQVALVRSLDGRHARARQLGPGSHRAFPGRSAPVAGPAGVDTPKLTRWKAWRASL
jgi:HK97 family phage prohead protease